MYHAVILALKCQRFVVLARQNSLAIFHAKSNVPCRERIRKSSSTWKHVPCRENRRVTFASPVASVMNGTGGCGGTEAANKVYNASECNPKTGRLLEQQVEAFQADEQRQFDIFLQAEGHKDRRRKMVTDQSMEVSSLVNRTPDAGRCAEDPVDPMIFESCLLKPQKGVLPKHGIQQDDQCLLLNRNSFADCSFKVVQSEEISTLQSPTAFHDPMLLEASFLMLTKDRDHAEKISSPVPPGPKPSPCKPAKGLACSMRRLPVAGLKVYSRRRRRPNTEDAAAENGNTSDHLTAALRDALQLTPACSFSQLSLSAQLAEKPINTDNSFLADLPLNTDAPMEGEFPVENGLSVQSSSAANEQMHVPNTQEFIASLIRPIETPILHSIPMTNCSASSTSEPISPAPLSTSRRSDRLSKQSTRGKDPVRMAQEVLFKKLGALSPSSNDVSDTVNSYAQRFAQPLSKEAIEVIKALVDSGNQHQKRGGRSRNATTPAQADASTAA